MKSANALYYPLAVLAGGVALFAGVRVANLPSAVVVPVAAVIATAGAIALRSRESETLTVDNPELAQELQATKQQAQALADQANALRSEATPLLTQAAQMELLGSVQSACDRAVELPAKINQMVERLQGVDSLLTVSDLQRQLDEVQTKLKASSGVAHEQLNKLAASLQHNIELAQQGQDVRRAQVASLSTFILDATGVLRSLQNNLRTADLSNSDKISELRSLSDELTSVQESIELLV